MSRPRHHSPRAGLRHTGTHPGEDVLPRRDAPTLPPGGIEITSIKQLDAALAQGVPPSRLRLQDLDLRAYHGLDLLTDLDELVVLGGELSPLLDEHLRNQGAIVFPDLPDAAPIRPYRATLYTTADLYRGLDRRAGYGGTPDGLAYTWYRERLETPDVFASLLQAIHDDSISDALAEFVAGRSVVGVMGGHALARGTKEYADAARLGHRLAEAGHLVATGGGPGAMEAANLGAAARTSRALGSALAALAAVPGFVPDVAAWVRCGIRARALLTDPAAPGDPANTSAEPRSLGVPTWYYGHEPPNVFADGIAKYFSNAIREDILLAISGAGVVVMPGAAGTVQEIFQVATRAYYTHTDTQPAPLILVGRAHWTDRIPVWPALQALARGRAMERAIHLVDHPSEAVLLL